MSVTFTIPVCPGVLFSERISERTSRRLSRSLFPTMLREIPLPMSASVRIPPTASFIVVSANGKQLPAGTSDEIKPCGKDQFMNMTSSVKEIEGCGDKLDIKIDFSCSGALFHAGLDYIEVFYERSLSLRDGQLYFFDSYSGSEESAGEGLIRLPHRYGM